jgi:hypothetical protein
MWCMFRFIFARFSPEPPQSPAVERAIYRGQMKTASRSSSTGATR